MTCPVLVYEEGENKSWLPRTFSHSGSRMKTFSVLLVLLLSLSEAVAQGERGLEVKEIERDGEPGALIQPDMSDMETELRELRDMVVEMRAETRLSLRNLEEEVKEQKDLVADLRLELGITKHEVEGLAKANAG